MYEVNWIDQWATHAPGFKEGKAHIPLPNKEIIKLLPGPGFGDFSHPTTRLMIDLMSPFIQNKVVLDIGCGSGILSIAAAKMGASKVYSCDIDQKAMEHTHQNALLNHIQLFTDLSELKKPVVLMNMIASEQIQAWEKYQLPFCTLITCGVLAAEKGSYLQFTKKNQWRLIQQHQSDIWLGCIFKESYNES